MYRIKEQTRKLPKTFMLGFFSKNAQNFPTWNLMVSF